MNGSSTTYRFVIVLLAVLLLGVIVLDPMTRQEIVPTGVTLSASEPVCICNAVREQTTISIWGDRVIWDDYRNNNWDIYGYNISSEGEFGIRLGSVTQRYPHISGNYLIFQEEDEQEYQEPLIYNFTDYSSTVIDNDEYGQVLVMGVGNIYAGWQTTSRIVLYDVDNGLETDLREIEEFDYSNSYIADIHGYQLLLHINQGDSYVLYHYNHQTDTVKSIDSAPSEEQISFGYFADENTVVYTKRNGTSGSYGMSLYTYSVDTGVTNLVWQSDPVTDGKIYTVQSAFGDYVTMKRIIETTEHERESELLVYNLAHDDFHDIGWDFQQIGYSDVYNDTLVFTAGDSPTGQGDKDVYMLTLSTTGVIDDGDVVEPSPAEQFIEDYWVYIVAIIFIVGGLLVAEYYFYKFEHIKKMGSWIGIIISAVIIGAILLYWWVI